jgi:hypothetical protein
MGGYLSDSSVLTRGRHSGEAKIRRVSWQAVRYDSSSASQTG